MQQYWLARQDEPTGTILASLFQGILNLLSDWTWGLLHGKDSYLVLKTVKTLWLSGQATCVFLNEQNTPVISPSKYYAHVHRRMLMPASFCSGEPWLQTGQCAKNKRLVNAQLWWDTSPSEDQQTLLEEGLEGSKSQRNKNRCGTLPSHRVTAVWQLGWPA